MNTPPETMVESPCIGVCRLMENTDVCAGCHRTVAEIAAWSGLADAAKRDVLVAVRQRESNPAPTRGTPQPGAP